jgi:hypothetical protein
MLVGTLFGAGIVASAGCKESWMGLGTTWSVGGHQTLSEKSLYERRVDDDHERVREQT